MLRQGTLGPSLGCNQSGGGVFVLCWECEIAVCRLFRPIERLLLTPAFHWNMFCAIESPLLLRNSLIRCPTERGNSFLFGLYHRVLYLSKFLRHISAAARHADTDTDRCIKNDCWDLCAGGASSGSVKCLSLPPPWNCARSASRVSYIMPNETRPLSNGLTYLLLHMGGTSGGRPLRVYFDGNFVGLVYCCSPSGSSVFH